MLLVCPCLKGLTVADIGCPFSSLGKTEPNKRKGPWEEEVQVTKSNQSLGRAGGWEAVSHLSPFLLPQK